MVSAFEQLRFWSGLMIFSKVYLSNIVQLIHVPISNNCRVFNQLKITLCLFTKKLNIQDKRKFSRNRTLYNNNYNINYYITILLLYYYNKKQLKGCYHCFIFLLTCCNLFLNKNSLLTLLSEHLQLN